MPEVGQIGVDAGQRKYLFLNDFGNMILQWIHFISVKAMQYGSFQALLCCKVYLSGKQLDDYC